MSLVDLIIRDLIGIFVDDAFLALAVLGIVGFAALATFWLALPPLAVGGFLLAGCVGALMASVLRRRAG